jgi:hypothetical protein
MHEPAEGRYWSTILVEVPPGEGSYISRRCDNLQAVLVIARVDYAHKLYQEGIESEVYIASVCSHEGNSGR